MKIVCDSCGAKYSIADEKVQGKVFKIRCKKCSNVIVVKGTDDAADDGYGGAAAEWYVVIDGDQVGPIPSVEIDSYYMAGKIGADSFVWRDGLSDWVAISTLPEFAHLTQGDVAGPDEATQIAQSPDFGDEAESDATAVASFDAGAISAAGAGASAASSGDDMFGGAPADDETINAGVSNDFGNGDDFAGGGYGGPDYGGSDYDGGSSDYGDNANYGDDSGYGGGSDYGDNSDIGYAASQGDDAYGAAEDDGYGGFSAAAAGGSGGYGAMDSSDPEGDDGGGMFAAFDSGSEDDDGGDFMSFGGGGSSSGSNPANGSAGAAGGRAGAGFVSQNDMVGQRNENSVLFSLSSLDQVAAVPGSGGGAGPAAGGGGGGMPAAGGDGPVTEGSGLIDIRALASAHESMKGSGGDADELDPFAHGTMSMPALMPMGSHRSNKPLIIGAAIGGILFLGLVGVVLAVMLGGDDDSKGGEQVVIREVIKEVAIPSPADDEARAKEQEEAENAAKLAKEAAEEGAAESGSEEKAAEEEDDKEPAKTTKKAPSSSSKSSPPAKKEPSRSSSKGDGIDNLLKTIDSDKRGSSASGPKGTESAGSGLKKALSKKEVGDGIKRYFGRVRTCQNNHNSKNLTGKMEVKFYIKPDGRVTNVSVVTGKFKGTDLGGCVSKVVRGMRFPATTASSNIPITFPFVLK